MIFEKEVKAVGELFVDGGGEGMRGDEGGGGRDIKIKSVLSHVFHGFQVSKADPMLHSNTGRSSK